VFCQTRFSFILGKILIGKGDCFRKERRLCRDRHIALERNIQSTAFFVLVTSLQTSTAHIHSQRHQARYVRAWAAKSYRGMGGIFHLLLRSCGERPRDRRAGWAPSSVGPVCHSLLGSQSQGMAAPSPRIRHCQRRRAPRSM
jgi:hypothetical protein